MRGCVWLAVIPAALAFGALAFVLALFLVKVLWAWTIPDLFPGAVEQGLIAKDMTWLTALKVAIFIGVFAGFSGGTSVNRRRES